MSDAPTFIAKFNDGTVTRMTTHCGAGGRLDLKRGVALAVADYESRMKKKPPLNIEGRFVQAGEDGGTVLRSYDAEDIAKALKPKETAT